MFPGAIYTCPCLYIVSYFSSFSFIPLVWLTPGVDATSFYKQYVVSCCIFFFFSKQVCQFIILFGHVKLFTLFRYSKSWCTERAHLQIYNIDVQWITCSNFPTQGKSSMDAFPLLKYRINKFMLCNTLLGHCVAHSALVRGNGVALCWLCFHRVYKA